MSILYVFTITLVVWQRSTCTWTPMPESRRFLKVLYSRWQHACPLHEVPK